MRQLEGALLSNIALERSKQRLQQHAVHRGRGVRDRRRCRARRTWSTSSFKVKERPSAQHRRRHRLFGVAEIHAERQLQRQQLHGHRQRAWRCSSIRASTTRSTASRIPIPYVSVDGLSRTRLAQLPRFDAVRVGILGLHARTTSALGLDLRLPDHRVPARQRAACRCSSIDLLTYAGSSAQQARRLGAAERRPVQRKVLSTTDAGRRHDTTSADDAVRQQVQRPSS